MNDNSPNTSDTGPLFNDAAHAANHAAGAAAAAEFAAQTAAAQAQQAIATANAAAAVNYSAGLGKLFKKPDEYDGKDRYACSDFISQVRLFIAGNSGLFQNDNAKIIFVATYLRGKAFAWIEPYLNRTDLPWMVNFELFCFEMMKSLGDPDRTNTMTKRLKQLRQTSSCTNYRTEFDSVAQYLSINDAGLKTYFYDGLKADVKDALALVINEPTDFKSFQDLCVKIDNRLFERKQESRNPSPAAHKPSGHQHKPANNNNHFRKPVPIKNFAPRVNVYAQQPANPAPMDLDGAGYRKFKPLTPQEREHRVKNNLCLYCGKPGHRAGNCPAKQRPQSRIAATLVAPDGTVAAPQPNRPLN